MAKKKKDYNSWGYGGIKRRDYRAGAVEPDDFDREFDYQTKVARNRKSRPEWLVDSSGCSGNDNGPHIYVWTTEVFGRYPHSPRGGDFFYKVFGWDKYEYNVCVGCEQTGKYKRLTQRYEAVKERKYRNMYGDGSNQPRGNPAPRYGYGYPLRKPAFWHWNWEKHDEKFIAAGDEFLDRNGDSWQNRLYVGRY